MTDNTGWTEKARAAAAEARKAGKKTENLTQTWLRQMAAMAAGMNRHEGSPTKLKYQGHEDLISKEGDDFEPGEPLPKKKMGKMKLCFMNAYKLADDHPDKYAYVEGFARVHGLPFPVKHAWNVDLETGKVADPTWSDGKEYRGIPIDMNYARKTILKNGTYGVIGNMKEEFPLLTGKHKVEDVRDKRVTRPPVENSKLVLLNIRPVGQIDPTDPHISIQNPVVNI